MHKVYTNTPGLQGRVHHGRRRRADVWGCGSGERRLSNLFLAFPLERNFIIFRRALKLAVCFIASASVKTYSPDTWSRRQAGAMRPVHRAGWVWAASCASYTRSGSVSGTMRIVGSTMGPHLRLSPLTQKRNRLVEMWLVACNPAFSQSSRATGLHGSAIGNTSGPTVNLLHCVLTAQVKPGRRLLIGSFRTGDCSASTWPRYTDPRKLLAPAGRRTRT